MSIDSSLIPTSLDLFHLVLGALVAILLLLTVVLAFLPFMAVRAKGRKAEPLAPVSVTAPREVLLPSPPESALQLLGLFQQEARFLDFINEDIRQHGDAEIGAAVRVVHEGCRRVLRQHVELHPVLEEAEGSSLTLPSGFNPAEIRLSGNLVGQPPFRGVVRHRGWKATKVQLPLLAEGHDAAILAAAEVEL